MLKERRDFSEAYWKEKKKEYYNDAVEVRRLKDEEKVRQQKQAIEEDEKEKERRKRVMTQEQSLGPSLSTKVSFPSGKSLGVFSTPYGDGEYSSTVNGGHLPGVDDYENDLFQKAQHTDYEERRTKYMDSQADEGQKEDLYESLKIEIKQLNDELDTTVSLFSRLATEAEQNQTEMDQLLLSQAGPPRRDPTPDEKITAHERKKRARNLAGEMKIIKQKEHQIREKISAATNQSGRVAAKLASLRQTNKTLKGEVRIARGRKSDPA